MSPQNQRREYQPAEQLPAQDYTVPQAQPQFRPQPQPQAPSQVTRRGLLRGGLIGGGIGVAVAAGAGAAVGLTGGFGQTSLKPASKPVAMAPMAPDATEGPLVVYISDPSAGILDVYAGTGATQIHNPALVTQLLKNLK